MSWFINSYLWVVYVFIHFYVISYLSLRANNDDSWKYLIYVYLLSLIPCWTIISRYSNSLPLAGFIYDFTVTLSWAVCVSVFNSKSFSTQHYVGIAIMFTGIMVFKKG